MGKLQFIFKSKNQLPNNCFKDLITRIIIPGVVSKCHYGLWSESHYEECVRHLAARRGGHVVILPKTNKTVQLKNVSFICRHLISSNRSASSEGFSVLCYKNKKHLVKRKGSLFIMRDHWIESLNQNISLLYLFEWNLLYCLLHSVNLLWSVFSYFHLFT